MKLNSSTISIIVVTLLLAGGAYWYFFTGTGTDAPLTADMSSNAAKSQFQMLITRLPSSFTMDIFSDPKFMALIDLATPIAPETSGRPDPFAPISGVSNK